MKNKIGVGVITCNAPERFEGCIKTIPNVDELVIVNDGEAYDSALYPSEAEVIQHSRNKCVGISKNDALRHLIQSKCDHIFLVEDDMLIQNPDVFTHYIHAAEGSGIWHLNFGYHGPANMTEDGQPKPRQVVEYDNGPSIALNAHCVGAFTYFLKSVVKSIGYHDEHFKNCWEHVEHTNRIIKAGLHPPFWWFADVADSHEYIKEYASSEVSSVIRKDEAWQQNMREGMEWFKHKHGLYPTQNPDTPPQQVMAILEKIEANYARKVL
jgi:glycosyltransferase involved in cell wall biosynthesis